MYVSSGVDGFSIAPTSGYVAPGPGPYMGPGTSVVSSTQTPFMGLVPNPSPVASSYNSGASGWSSGGGGASMPHAGNAAPIQGYAAPVPMPQPSGGQGPLPSGWEERRTPEGRPYYVGTCHNISEPAHGMLKSGGAWVIDPPRVHACVWQTITRRRHIGTGRAPCSRANPLMDSHIRGETMTVARDVYNRQLCETDMRRRATDSTFV